MPPDPKPAPILAKLTSVTHRYGPVVALDGLDLEVRRGEVLGVLGPNGAGKTTAISLLLGSLHVQNGTATVLVRRPAHQRCGFNAVPCSRYRVFLRT